MSDSQSPKLRRAEGWAKLIASIIAIIGSVWVGILTLWSTVGDVTTDKELMAHNDEPKAHPPLRQQLDKCLASTDAMSKRIEKDYQETVILGGRLTRLIASDREPNHSLKAAAATYYQEEYMRNIRKGHGVEEAMLESLRSPWYDRPRGK